MLFKAAKDKLGAAEFDKLLGSVPGLVRSLKKAPASGGGGLGGLLGGLAGAIGGNAGAHQRPLSAASASSGLNPDDAKKFVPVILDFLRTKVGPDVVSKLEKTLRA